MWGFLFCVCGGKVRGECCSLLWFGMRISRHQLVGERNEEEIFVTCIPRFIRRQGSQPAAWLDAGRSAGSLPNVPENSTACFSFPLLGDALRTPQSCHYVLDCLPGVRMWLTALSACSSPSARQRVLSS